MTRWRGAARAHNRTLPSKAKQALPVYLLQRAAAATRVSDCVEFERVLPSSTYQKSYREFVGGWMDGYGWCHSLSSVLSGISACGGWMDMAGVTAYLQFSESACGGWMDMAGVTAYLQFSESGRESSLLVCCQSWHTAARCRRDAKLEEGCQWIKKTFTVEGHSGSLGNIFSPRAFSVSIGPVTPETFIAACANSVPVVRSLFPRTMPLATKYILQCLVESLGHNNISIAEWLDGTFHVMDHVNTTPGMADSTLKKISESYCRCLRGLQCLSSEDVAKGLKMAASANSGKVVKWLLQKFHLSAHQAKCAEWLIRKYHLPISDIRPDSRTTPPRHLRIWKMLMCVYPEMTRAQVLGNFFHFIEASPLHIRVTTKRLGITTAEIQHEQYVRDHFVCFGPNATILMSSAGQQCPMKDLQVGDSVLAYYDGRGTAPAVVQCIWKCPVHKAIPMSRSPNTPRFPANATTAVLAAITTAKQSSCIHQEFTSTSH
ncbi:hypothetical protein Pelo_8522 [Pelomyxa schiedti]|nr:hypothetical protein Pelo_8522 [Pelomyxa schiedti]